MPATLKPLCWVAESGEWQPGVPVSLLVIASTHHPQKSPCHWAVQSRSCFAYSCVAPPSPKHLDRWQGSPKQLLMPYLTCLTISISNMRSHNFWTQNHGDILSDSHYIFMSNISSQVNQKTTQTCFHPQWRLFLFHSLNELKGSNWAPRLWVTLLWIQGTKQADHFTAKEPRSVLLISHFIYNFIVLSIKKTTEERTQTLMLRPLQRALS